MSERHLYLGMDVHKESVVVAVLRVGAAKPTDARRLPNDRRKLRRFFKRAAREGLELSRFDGHVRAMALSSF